MGRLGGVWWVALATGAALLLTACTHTSPQAHEPSEVRLAIGGEPDDGFDPTLGWGRYGSPLFHSTLFKLDADLNVVNDLATQQKVSEDGLKWTVTIREDAVFHDGEPVTAGDVAFTFDTALSNGGLVDVQMLKSTEIIDDTTIEFILREPRSNFLYQLSTIGVVPEHAYDADYQTHPVGSGPYRFIQWDVGQQLIVERFDDYYGDLPEIERLVFMFTQEDGRVAAIRAGQADIAGVASSLATADIAHYEVIAVPSIDNRGVSLPFVPDEGSRLDGKLIGNNVTSDFAMRRALNYAVDRNALVEGVLEGFGSAAQGPADLAPWHEPKAAIQDSDSERARQLLSEGGWRPASDGVLEKNGVRAEFTVLYPAGDPIRQALTLALKDQVRELGVSLTAEGATWDEISQRMHADAVMFGFGSHDPMETYFIYGSDMAGVDYFNPGLYSSAAVDEHFRNALTATEPERALEAWRAAQLDSDGNGYSVDADAAWLWLVNLDHTYYVNDCLDLGALQVEPHGHGWPITAGIAEWQWRC